ncbi:MAG: FoF1 ATP synthase subunit delta/epsilon [Acidimicrobiales bacterium]|jgi:F-type H+-transporting ATPase subunit epsilon
MANLTHAELITPERVLFSGDAEAVVMRADRGDITFLADHMDYIGSVDICVVRIQGVHQRPSPAEGAAREGGAARVAPPDSGDRAGEATPGESAPIGDVHAAVHGGFVMVADNKVTIVSGVAELAEEIDVERARRALETAEAAASNLPEPGAGGAGGGADAGGTEAPTAEGQPAGDAAAAAAAAARARARLEAVAELKATLSRL